MLVQVSLCGTEYLNRNRRIGPVEPLGPERWPPVHRAVPEVVFEPNPKVLWTKVSICNVNANQLT